MIPEVRACSGYLVITPKRAYRDNARALMTPQEVMPVYEVSSGTRLPNRLRTYLGRTFSLVLRR
jgi:hypothetical protein